MKPGAGRQRVSRELSCAVPFQARAALFKKLAYLAYSGVASDFDTALGELAEYMALLTPGSTEHQIAGYVPEYR